MPRKDWVESTNILSSWLIWWINGVVIYGYKHDIVVRTFAFLEIFLSFFGHLGTEEDIPELRPFNEARSISQRFEKAWSDEVKKSPEKVFSKTIGPYYIKPLVGMAFWVAANLVGPAYLMPSLISWFSDPNPSKDRFFAYMYILGFFLYSMSAAILIHRTFQYSVRAALRARMAMMIAVYSKATRLSSVSSTIGEIVTMQSNDAFRVMEGVRWFLFLPAVFCTVTVVLVLVVLQVGVIPGIVGVALLVGLFLPSQILIGRYVQGQRRIVAGITDIRIRLMSEILTAIKLVKLYSWEKSFSDNINAIREREIANLRRSSIVKLQNGSLALMIPIFATFVTFVVFVYINGADKLTATIVYTTSSLYDATRFVLGMQPQAIRAATETMVAWERLKKFLLLPEAEDYRQLDSKAPKKGISVKSAEFKWPEEGNRDIGLKRGETRSAYISKSRLKFDEENKLKAKSKRNLVVQPKVEKDGDDRPLMDKGGPTLEDINLEVGEGELVAIVGRVGSGKSSMLGAILGQIPILKGSVSVHGSVAYASQQAWIMNQNLRGNILFGEEFNHDRYVKTLAACQLIPDLEQFPAGDFTEIGERGINLSGGQKQRVSLARAVYSDRDIYVFDDPLSAVDQHVGNKIFHQCIRGVLAKKTVVLVTNQLQYLPKCDRVVVMKHGKIAAIGTYGELVAKNVDFGIPAEKKKMKKLKESVPIKVDSDAAYKKTMQALSSVTVDFSKYESKLKEGKLVSSEDRVVGSVGWSVYMDYSRSSGSIAFLLLIVLMFALAQGARVISDMWLAWWVASTYGDKVVLRDFYVYIWAILVGGTFLMFVLRNVAFTLWTLSASKNLHNGIFAKVLRAPMSFFDSTPIGRILNRFSKDQDSLDDQLPDALSQMLHYSMQMISNIVLICVVNPWFIIAVVPCLIAFYFFSMFYRKSSRQLKRIDGISRSPIFAHLSATLSGLSTIRAYGVTDRFLTENFERVNKNARATYYFEMCARWLGMRLDFVVAIMVTCTAIVLVFVPVAPSVAGVALIYSLQMATMFQWLVRVSIETENQFTSVERLLHYEKNLPYEGDYVVPGNRPVANWPSEGKIEFKNVTVTYNEKLAPVLSDLSFVTKPAEKIGIVGRTGAGKSTLVITIFRIIELSGGKILIDDVDISKIGLYDLRSKLGIIPQDPVLFTGSIRENLDPFYEHEDHEIWDVLEKVHMKTHITSLKDGLGAEVVENGENFSVGQRQLLCIGRALLRNSKILVLDEATASIDLQTDDLIQKTIRESFQHCTVLTIAHRLHTIIDSDRIMVLERGKLMELETPAKLLGNSQSLFTKLVEDTGPAESAKLKALAAEKLKITIPQSGSESASVTKTEKSSVKREKSKIPRILDEPRAEKGSKSKAEEKEKKRRSRRDDKKD